MAPSSSGPTRTHGSCFPINAFVCCPAPVKLLVPKPWRVIQDRIHLSLLVGFGCLCWLAFADLWSFTDRPEASRQALQIIWYTKVGLVAAVSVLLFPRMVCMINGYNLGILAREKRVAQKRVELSGAYEDIISNMDDTLQRAARSSAGFAESDFESKRRDFIRFLAHVEEKASSLVMTNLQAAGLLIEFRNFLTHWLAIFSECSASPRAQPLVFVGADELDACRTVPAAASLVRSRLECTVVRIVGDHADQDQQVICGARKFADCFASRGGRGAERLPGAAVEGAGSGIEMATSFMSCATLEAQLCDTEDSRVAAARNGNGDVCGWFRCGGGRCGLRRSPGRGFPVTVCWRIMEVQILSWDHLIYVWAAWLLAATCMATLGQLIEETRHAQTKDARDLPWRVPLAIFLQRVSPAIGVLQAVTVVLAFFGSIDAVQRQERQISRLEAESQALERRQEVMVTFWQGVQAVTDIWAHRTVPRLAMMKEVHNGLADIWDAEGLRHTLEAGNLSLRHLETSLPELSLWTSSGPVTKEQKMRFEAGIKKLCAHADNLPELFEGIESLCQSGAIPRIAPGTSFTC